jgi:hypothetical protein
MRSLYRSALVVVSAVVVLLGASPAANAAEYSIGWSQSGGVLGPGQSPTVCPTASAFQSGQKLRVQVLKGGAWVDKHTYTVKQKYGWCFAFDATTLVPGPGKYSFRAVTRVPSTGDLAMTGKATFTLRKDDGRFYWMDSGDFMATNEWMGSGLRLSTKSAKHRTAHVRISRAHGQTVYLQRKSGSKWVNVSRTKAPATGSDVTVPVKIPARAGLAKHRFVSRATAWSPTVATGSFTVYQTAKVNRSSYIAEARHYMAKYCPKTPISIDTRAVAERTGGSHLGLATGSWGTTRTGKILVTKIELRSGMSPDQLRSVALHECAHIIQYRSVVKGRYGEMNRQALKLWPGLGVEGQADCMSYQITKDYHWFGYVDGCSKGKLLNAAKMWKTYGGKYHAAVYRW